MSRGHGAENGRAKGFVHFSAVLLVSKPRLNRVVFVRRARRWLRIEIEMSEILRLVLNATLSKIVSDFKLHKGYVPSLLLLIKMTPTSNMTGRLREFDALRCALRAESISRLVFSLTNTPSTLRSIHCGQYSRV